MAAPNHKRRRFNLLTLLVFVAILAIPCIWLVVKMQQVKRQREAVAAIEKVGGWVWLEPSGPPWLRSLLGDDYFGYVSIVDCCAMRVTDVEMEHLKALPQLQDLILNHTKVTDAGLTNLQGCGELQKLLLVGTHITGAGLKHLQGLSRLQRLSLARTPITDGGLANLKGMNQLRVVNLSETQVTDAGLENLKDLRQLQALYLGYTKVTNEGVKKLQQALPNCKIHGL